jgi:MFS family permease
LPLAGINMLTQASRVVLSVVGPALAVEYGLSASELGLLSAAMFAAYGLWQLPVGLLLDLYGPRRVQAAMGVTGALGFALFALSDGLAGFLLARMLIGVGVAAGLMAVLKAHSQWYRRADAAGVTGIVQLIGGLGGLAVTLPANALLPLIGWRGIFGLLACVALAMAAWVFLALRDRPAPPRRGLAAEVAVYGRIYRSAVFWRLTPAVAMLTVINFAYQGLWVGPWLRDTAGMDDGARAGILFAYAVGLMCGSLVTGQLASRIQARGHSPMLVPWGCAVAMIGVQLLLLVAAHDFWTMALLWAALPFFASAGPPGYAAIAQRFEVAVIGRVSTAINALTLTGAFGLQALIGWLLDLWPRTQVGGWDPAGYGWAMGLAIAAQIASLAWAWRR